MTYCIINNCEMAAQCCHFTASSQMADDSSIIKIINPKIKEIGTNCKFFDKSETKNLAYGFTNMLRTLRRSEEDAFRRQMLSRYSRTRYFQMRRGEYPLNEEKQEEIMKLLVENGYKGTASFDRPLP